MVVRHARTTPQGQVTPGLFLRPPAAGSVPHIYTKSATAYYLRAGWSVCGGGVGRPAVVPPAGRGSGLGAPLSGRWGREGGALSSKAPRKVRPARRSSPTGSAPGLGAAGSETQPDVGCWWVRTKWTRSLPGGRRPRGLPRRMKAPTVPMFVPAVALDHSDHALSEPKKRAN